MLKLKDEYWQEAKDQLIKIFKEIYYDPLLELFEDEKILYNSSNALLDAINKGFISIKDNVISGKFTIAISKELSKFATFDGRSKTFRVNNTTLIPHDVYMANFIAIDKSKKLYAEMNRRLKYMDADAKERFKKLHFSIDKSADQIEAVLNKEFEKIGIKVNLETSIKEKLKKDYNQNMSLSIVDEKNPGQDWNSEQVERLRSMVEKNALEGLNKKQLLESIQNEFEISKNKAVFLVRQETSLFLSKLSTERYIDAGLDYYMWLNSHDIRTVGNPSGLYPEGNDQHGDHWVMAHKICRFDDPSVYADSIEDAQKGIWKSKASIGADNKHTGESYGCRCVKKALIL
jgi:hypothetical protein